MKSINKLILIFFALMTFSAVNADNVLSIKDFSMKAGETAVVDINLDNTDPICVFNIRITFPDGFSTSTKKSDFKFTEERYFIDEDIENEKTLDSRQWENQQLYLIAHDTDNVPFSGNSGSIFTFKIIAAQDVQPGVYEFKVTDAAVGTPEAVNYDTPDFTFKVTIESDVVDVTGVTLDKTELTMNVGDTETLVATVAPDNATDKTLTWSTSDAAVATVENGVVNAVAAGTADITVTTANGKTATCKVTVKTPVVDVTGVTLDKTELTLNVGDTETLVATVAPDNATDKTLTWSTSDAAVATVENGVVKAVAAGTADITVTTANGKTATCKVTVKTPVVDVTGVTLDQEKLELEVGKTATLTATVAPDNATDKTLTWSTSDANVATVDGGVVTAVAAGTAIITVTTANGKTATCEVTVKNPVVEVTGVTLDKTELTLYLANGAKTETLVATIAPENATDKTLTWSSSDETIVTVEDGVVTAVSVGIAVVTVKTANGKEAKCLVTVEEDAAVENITVDGMRKNTGVYTIAGQYVGKSTESLSKGVYIVNGKKIVIR